jgi:hypothetical protein
LSSPGALALGENPLFNGDPQATAFQSGNHIKRSRLRLAVKQSKTPEANELNRQNDPFYGFFST